MVAEQTCLYVIRALYGRKTVLELGIKPDTGDHVTETKIPDGLLVVVLQRDLLTRFPLEVVESSLRWLELQGYLETHGIGVIAPKLIYSLTDIGRTVAERGHFSLEEQRLIHHVEPYSVFVARQFAAEDSNLSSSKSC